MRSNCVLEAWRLYRLLSRDDLPGNRTWVCITRSWEKGVPFHVGVTIQHPQTGQYEIIHFQPVEKKWRPWWPEWKFRGFRKRGDWVSTAIPADDPRGNERRAAQVKRDTKHGDLFP